MKPGALVGNVFLLGSILCTVSSQLLLKRVIDEARLRLAGGAAWLELLTQERVLRSVTPLLLTVFGFVLWVLCLTRLDLAYAYPIACASVLLVTFFSAIFLHEAVTARTWAGTVLVLVGIALLGPAR